MPKRNPSILIAEDNFTSLELLRGMLKTLGYKNVTACRDGTSALAAYEKDLHDLVFLDLNLPGAHGLEILPKICELNRHVFVVVVSGEGDVKNIQATLDAGVQSFIVKPYSPARIEDAVTLYQAFCESFVK